jgi:WD40 repeat protein
VLFQYGQFPPAVPASTLLADFRPSVLPSRARAPLGAAASVKALAFVDGGATLLAGAGERVGVWAASSGEHCGDLTGHTARVWSVAVAGQTAATGSADGTVRLWSVADRTQIAVLAGHAGDIYSVDVVGRRVVSGGCDQAVVVWDAETGAPEATLKGHSEAVTAVLIGAGGSVVVSGGSDLSVQLWDVRSGLVAAQLAPVLGEVTGLAADAAFARVIAATRDNTNRVWDLRMSDAVRLLRGHRNAQKHFVRARFGPDERTVIGGSEDGRIWCWDASSGAVIEKIAAHSGGVYDVVWSSHGHCFASCGEDPGILLWSPRGL